MISEEIDTLYPSDRNRVHFAEMPEGEVRDYAEVLRVADGTNVLGTYEQDYYKGMAAVTERTCQTAVPCISRPGWMMLPCSTCMRVH